MKNTQAVIQRINELLKEIDQSEFEKSSGLNLKEVLLKQEFSCNELVAICKGLDVELVEFFASPVFELNNLA